MFGGGREGLFALESIRPLLLTLVDPPFSIKLREENLNIGRKRGKREKGIT